MNQVKKIIEYGLYLLVFLLPFQTRWIIRQGAMAGWPYEFGTLSLYAIDILLVILLALNAYAKITCPKKDEQKNTHVSLMWWLIGGVELLTFISIFVAVDKAIALQAYLRLLLGIGLFWLIVSTTADKQKLINAFIASAAVQAALGIWQFFAQATLANKFLGMARHLPIDQGDSVVTAINGMRWLRAYGGLDHPNVFGGLMAIALLLVLIQLASPRPSPSPGEGVKKYFLYYIAIVILTCGLFFSFSRAAWLGCAIGIVIMTAGELLHKGKNKIRLLAKYLSLAAIIFCSLGFIYYGLISARTLNNTATENKSINDRLSSYKIDAAVLKIKWPLGTGVGNYGLAVHNNFYGLTYNDYQPVHNVYLLVFSEIGIIGFVCFFSLFIYFLYGQWKRGDICAMAIITSILAMFLFDHWWWSLHFGILFLFFICGILEKKESD